MRDLKNNNILNEIVYDKIYPTGSATAKIYGCPKMRKFTPSELFPKFRPIVTFIGTYNYQLPKYLYDLLSPHLPMDHCPEDSFTFVKEIKSVSLYNTSLSLMTSPLYQYAIKRDNRTRCLLLDK